MTESKDGLMDDVSLCFIA